MSSYNIKYVFKAEFKDGTTYLQNWEDKPVIADHGSSFTDIVDRLDEIKTFSLIEYDNIYDVLREVCSVDLTTGAFTIKGVPFLVKSPSVKITPDSVFRLIYFRQVSIVFNIENKDQLGHNVQYNIGWQTTINGENYQQTIAIE